MTKEAARGQGVAVPSRIFVGVTVFGLIASLVVVPYTALVLSGYRPPPDAPYEALFPEEGGHDVGDRAFLVLASLFSLLMLGFGWRSLLKGARRDLALRRERSEGGKARPAKPPEDRGPRPPGYP